jgi:hypothetical protein
MFPPIPQTKHLSRNTCFAASHRYDADDNDEVALIADIAPQAAIVSEHVVGYHFVAQDVSFARRMAFQ